MKRLMIVPAACLLLLVASSVMAEGWGIGGFGGITIPIEQDDAENGTVFGVRGRWSGLWSLTIEPQILLLQNGDYDIEYGENPTITETLKGWKATSFGLNLVLGAPVGKFKGVRPFFCVGGHLNTYDFDGRDADSQFGFGAGAGLEIGFDQFAFEIRATGEIFPDGNESSRKNAIITGGLNLYLGE
jgi:hypothetical protein